MVDKRRQTTQAIAWFWDLYRRGLIDLDPPYQRKSVWNQPYKDYFIDTVLLDYPAPPVFLHEDIDETGTARYAVVDGKQRLSSVFEFLEGRFPVSESATRAGLRGLSFESLSPEVKQEVFRYQLAVEFLPTTEEAALSNIFDRINRNVARLTPQELRHARFSGVFASTVDRLTDHMEEVMPSFPRIAAASRRQMKDAELMAQLLLLVEIGVNGYSQDELEVAYSERDEEWESAGETEIEAREVLDVLQNWSEALLANAETLRLRNQADFYSLFGAVLQMKRDGTVLERETAVARLVTAMAHVGSEDARQQDPEAKTYYEAARSASNDAAQRRTRINYLVSVLAGPSDDAGA